MVVLEEGGMLTTGHNQYLQPDYLSPLPTTLDAKKSPLALLAQTCSQIGADSPNKPSISPLDKSTKNGPVGTNARSPPAAKMERIRCSPSDSKPLAFKPYEINVLAKKSSDDGRPSSKCSVHSVSGLDSVSVGENNNVERKVADIRTLIGRKSVSPTNHSVTITSTLIVSSSNASSPSVEQKVLNQEREKTNDSPLNNGASPVIRSGMEMLSGTGLAKETSLGGYKHATGLGGFGGNSVCCPPGLSENPAFRPPFAGGLPFSHHHAAAAAALLGYPTATSTVSSNPYLNYTRVKTSTGGETLIPICKDPYCTGCQYNMHSAQMMMGGGACPSGCTQCEHQKYGLAMALSSLTPMPPPSLSYPPSLNGGRPYVCNWIAGETYCGKRFTSSEDLLQHLRSHTSFVGGDHNATISASLLGGPHSHSHPLLSPSNTLHRIGTGSNYPAQPLSPLSGRYHPYGKPPTGPLPTALGASPYSAFNTLSPYYSPYAVYNQRMGAAVHP
ncbi:hypothetical protein PV326_005122 [Microctonus aethiopoides]|nr:hypothetical protein PV326_005122 [Microctonus aethiopoides]